MTEQFKSTRMTTINNTDNTKCWPESRELEFSYDAAGM